MHNQEVAVYCHDALQMSELREIVRKYGTCASPNVWLCVRFVSVAQACSININGLCCAALGWFDMPYGLNVAAWDQLLSDVELDMFAKQVGIVNRARNHTLALSVI